MSKKKKKDKSAKWSEKNEMQLAAVAFSAAGDLSIEVEP